MEKMSVCQSCGKLANKTCKVCSAVVCSNCLENYGCKICKKK